MQLYIPFPFPVKDQLLPFLSSEHLSQKKIASIDFTDSTYHIHIVEKDHSEWIFLSLHPETDQIEDFFCSCEQCVKNNSCPHMIKALQAIFEELDIPLHKRFLSSPFGIISSAFFHHVEIQKKNTEIRLGQIVIQGKTDFLKEILHKKEDLSEENSIKFAHATEKELLDYQVGIISDHLSYELSPVTDLCKQIFIKHCVDPCSYSLQTDSISFIFKDLTCTFPLPSPLEPFLDSLLFYTPSSKSPIRLSFFGGRKASGYIVNPDKKSFSITFSKDSPPPEKTISSWSFPSKDLYLQTRFQTEIPLQELSMYAKYFFDNKPPSPFSYHIAISPQELTITPSLPHLPSLENCASFFSWTFPPFSQGIKTGSCLIPLKGVSVPSSKISSFVEKWENFLSLFPGCAVFPTARAHSYTYTVDANGALTFSASPCSSLEASIDFSHHVFVPTQGFYPKKSRYDLPCNTLILPHKIPSFITEHFSILQTIPNFFAENSPIQAVVPEITFSKKTVSIRPVYRFKTPEHADDLFIYGAYGYIKNVGFFPLPSTVDGISIEFSLSMDASEEWELFCKEKLPFFEEHFPGSIDTQLKIPSKLTLKCQGKEVYVDDTEKTVSYSTQLYWESEYGKVHAHEILPFFRKQIRFVPTDAGLLDLSDRRFAWLAHIPTPKKESTLTSFDFLKISSYDTIHLDQHTTGKARDFLQKLLYHIDLLPVDLSLFASDLRRYQLDGVKWLFDLYQCSLSALLCDDMGVGKTHQALALLSCVKAYQKGTKTRFLLICPTSLIYHWKEKIQSVLPSFTTLCYLGTDRILPQNTDEFDILLTTYGVFRNDSAALHTFSFDVAIFDELQLAKNHISQLWAALTTVSSTMKVGLTGTPIENSVRELRSIFDLILPGYFPKKLFSKKENRFFHHEDRDALIKAYTKPFILRRKKQDVLQELPAKSESIIHVEMPEGQKKLYQEVAQQEGRNLLSQLQDRSSPIPYMHIFALITTLKTICNHPAIYAKDLLHYHLYDSGKWNSFIELLEESLQSDEKVVIFSHSLKMLDIIASYASAQGIFFAQIRGSTKNRHIQLETFQKDKNCKLFIASLMAGGLGIDLTAASTVIHYDRWWNAARENQATDRVHRLGQSRGVNVYKLVTLSTIEERIDQIITEKASLLEGIIGYDDHRVIKQLSREELIHLLQDISSS